MNRRNVFELTDFCGDVFYHWEKYPEAAIRFKDNARHDAAGGIVGQIPFNAERADNFAVRQFGDVKEQIFFCALLNYVIRIIHCAFAVGAAVFVANQIHDCRGVTRLKTSEIHRDFFAGGILKVDRTHNPFFPLNPYRQIIYAEGAFVSNGFGGFGNHRNAQGVAHGEFQRILLLQLLVVFNRVEQLAARAKPQHDRPLVAVLDDKNPNVYRRLGVVLEAVLCYANHQFFHRQADEHSFLGGQIIFRAEGGYIFDALGNRRNVCFDCERDTFAGFFVVQVQQ